MGELAALERERGNLARAHGLADRSLSALESLRLKVMSPNLRATVIASARRIQELNIEILQQLHRREPGQGFDAAALLAAERGRARSLLELLA